MTPLQIQLNGRTVTPGATVPKAVTALVIRCVFPIGVGSQQAVQIKRWLNEVASRLTCDYVEYNGVLVSVEDIKIFKL